jgi:hypothetical protein
MECSAPLISPADFAPGCGTRPIKVTLVEPGGFEADWAGSSATFAAQLPAYDGLRAAVAAAWGDVKSGDPATTGPALAAAALDCGSTPTASRTCPGGISGSRTSHTATPRTGTARPHGAAHSSSAPAPTTDSRASNVGPGAVAC